MKKTGILIVRLSSLGDILLSTPVIRALKNKYPEREIHFLVKNEYKDLLSYNPNIDKLLIYGIDTPDIHSYEFILDLQNNRRSAKILKGFTGSVYRFKKRSVQKFLLVNFKWNLMRNADPIPVRYAASLPGLKLDDEGLELFTEREASPVLDGRQNIIGLTPGAKHFTKRWAEHYFIELGIELRQEGFTVVIFGGNDDKEICDRVSNAIDGSINLAGVNDILQTSADMKRCSLIVCNDSGLMHTATAVKVPVFAIFGSTVKEFGFSPYKIKNLIFEHKSLSCRPCSHIGRKRCPKGHFKCMLDLTPGNAIIEIKRFINR